MPTNSDGPRFRCPACQQTYRLRNADPARKYLCRKCRVPLAILDDAETVAVSPAPPPRPANLSSAPTTFDKPVPTAAQRTILEPPPVPSSLPRLRLDASQRTPAPPAQAAGPLDDLELSRSAVAPVDLVGLLPRSFDGYTIVRELARGGMGVVILAEQAELRRRIAMKVVLPGAAASDPAVRERFMREARAMAKLKHPHIVEVHGVGEVSGMPYLAMEFVECRTLGDLIERDSLGYAKASEVLAKVARALAYAHSRGVIHRDIKPANIMVRQNGEPVVMDFGLAKDFDANTLKLSMTGNIMGTPAYMSPEQAQGLQVDERSDIYSLGAVLYEMLTLEPPFGGTTTIATMYNVVNTPARNAGEVRPGVPQALARVCAKALEKDPRDRYQNMDEFAGDLDR
ncbi:MAG: serine/threonine-protein kinase, partial [Planctomycetota bacterium]|nr:serine/threonine-protein kinase [Planctomycetota bacterium]